MRKIKLTILALGIFFVAGAQKQANQKAGTQTTNTQTAVPADSSAAKKNSGEGAGAATNANATSPAAQTSGNSSTASVSQTTESMSGSPAILADDDGRKRDGTNSIQRASMNMAGSPVRNIKFPEKNVNPNSEIKQGTRAAESKNSSKDQGTKTATSSRGAEAKKMDNNTRNQNQDASDQSNASKKKAKSTGKLKDKKARRKG